MKPKKNRLVTIALAGMLTLGACGNSYKDYYEEGIVQEERGHITGILDSVGILGGPITDKSYLLKVKTDEGENYIIKIQSYKGLSVEALALAIEPGMKIRFVQGVTNGMGKRDSIGKKFEKFGNYMIGKLYANEIEIIND